MILMRVAVLGEGSSWRRLGGLGSAHHPMILESAKVRLWSSPYRRFACGQALIEGSLVVKPL